MHDYLVAFLGGLLLGFAVVGYLFVNGRIAGISGLIAQVMSPNTIFKSPAVWFLSGLFITPSIYGIFVKPDIVMNSNPLLLIIAGLLVGFGTRLGAGCTSGHGICGISRLSKRSIVATGTFILAGFMMVFILRHLMGAVE